ncbi:MAG: hypothetical protein M3R17_13925 [Bacteroidota bacterium]|nr:hypothetical protein [Bacteroidota bacterium]
MNTNFRQVLQLDIYHDFYRESGCRDFSVFTLPDTQKLLRNRQAIFSFKQGFGKMLILENVEGTSAAHPIVPGDVLLFGMELQNPSLANFTVEWPASKKIFLFTNVGNLTDPASTPVELIRSEISLSAKVITHVIVSNSASTLEIKNENGLLVNSMSINAGSAGREISFDVQHHSNGLFTISEIVLGVPTGYVYYADDTLLYKNIFALIRIVNQSAFPFNYDGKPFYRISFTSKSSNWKYYVVAPNLPGTDAGTTLSIEDIGRPPASAILFSKTYPIPSNDKTAPMLFKDLTKVVLFTSTGSLVYQQTPRQEIELRKGAMTLIGNLPNPDVSKPTTEMFIYV